MFKIYGLGFKHAIKPNGTIVPDAVQTQEFWLITYSEDTEEYIPESIGQFFYLSVTYYKVKDTLEMKMAIEVTHTDGLHVSKTKHLEQGYYVVHGTSPRVDRKHSSTRRPMYIDNVESISKKEFKSLKDDNTEVSMETIDYDKK